jgi:hypothetical protein
MIRMEGGILVIQTIISAMFVFSAFSISFDQALSTQKIRQVNLKSSAYEDAVKTLRDYWGDSDYAQENNIQEFQTKVAYGDLTGDGIEEAAVQVYYTMGGSGSFTGVFVYALEKGSPELIATIKGGDRAQGGIKTARIQTGQLVIESYRPNEEDCMACYGSILITRYELLAGKLVNVGAEATSLPHQRTTRSQRKRRGR